MESSKGYKNWRCASHLTSSRAVLLHQLQELSERECRARNQNQKLLQDFQKAQNTLSDLVACTEAMNNIRMEYERYLEENYPKWQQKLQEKTSEQRKSIEQHLKACAPQMEKEGQRTDRGNNDLFRTNPPSAISPDPSHCPIFNSLLNTSDHRDYMAEVSVSRNASFHPGSKQSRHGNIQNSIHSSIPFMCSTHLQPSVTKPGHRNSNITKNTTNIQNVHQGLNSSVLHPNLLSGDPLQSLYSVVQQYSPSNELLRYYPHSWASGNERFNPRVQCPTNCTSWSRLPLITGYVEKREKEGRQKRQEATSDSQDKNYHMQKERKKVISSDTKPVNILNYFEDSRESTNLSFKGVKSFPIEVKKRGNKRREEKQTQNTRKDSVSQGSSSISDGQSVPSHKKHKRNQQHNGSKTDFKTSKVAVEFPKQSVMETENDIDPVKGTLRDISNAVNTGEMRRYEKKDETKEESTGEKRLNDKVENHKKKASLREEQDKEGEGKKIYAEQNSTDEEEAQEEAPLRNNTSVKEPLFEEVDSVRQSEAEEGGAGEGDREDGEKRDEDKKSGASGSRSKKDDNESDQDDNYNEVLTSDSERNIKNSLRELHKDGTKDDLFEMEANIEEEKEDDDKDNDDDDDDDDDDGVIVEKASPWSCQPVFDDIYHKDRDTDAAADISDDDYDDDDDEDDDIEGLLAPQNNSLHDQPDEPHKILKSKGLNSDLEENAQGKDEPADCDNEFDDHFYD